MKINGVKESNEEPIKAKSEKELLIDEKIGLAKKIGIWGTFKPIDNYQDSKELKRIHEIDKRLANG